MTDARITYIRETAEMLSAHDKETLLKSLNRATLHDPGAHQAFNAPDAREQRLARTFTTAQVLREIHNLPESATREP